MLEPKTTSPIQECQPSPEECWTRSLTDDDYLFQLAANLKVLEDQQDQEGAGQLWSNYGNRDCLHALHIMEVHGEKMPSPNAPVMPGAGTE